MSGSIKFPVGTRVTLSHAVEDAYDWMVGHPAVITENRASGERHHYNHRYFLVFDTHFANPSPNFDPDHASVTYGWWVRDDTVILYETVKTSHDVW